MNSNIFLYFYNTNSSLEKKNILGLFANPPDRKQKPWLDQLVAAYNSDLNQIRVKKWQ